MINFDNFVEQFALIDTGLTRIRLGNKSDGGYVVLREICEKTEMVCSYGIGADIEFEKDFMDHFQKARIELYDPTISQIPIIEKPSSSVRVTFKKEGIGNGYNNKHRIKKNNTLLKLDIEWDEWDFLDHILEEDLARITQFIVEFHIVNVEVTKKYTPYFTKFYSNIYDHINLKIFAQYIRVLKKINQFFYLYHLHPNNSLPILNIGGYEIPPLLEASFVNKHCVFSTQKFKESLPLKNLDYPNKTDRTDIINFYPFKKVDNNVKSTIETNKKRYAYIKQS